jgi:hypothetical protein
VEAETVATIASVTMGTFCEEPGKTTYTATFENDAFETQTKTLTNLSALSHDWNAPTYEWAADLKSVTATRTCARDASHIETETVSVTGSETAGRSATRCPRGRMLANPPVERPALRPHNAFSSTTPAETPSAST